ncbi:MAG: polyamine ABC transporter substrate-binding protein [Actinomycetota bacterium]
MSEEGPSFDAALLRGLTQARLSRRQLLRSAGLGVGSLALAPLLAACSNGNGSGTGGTSTASATATAPTIDWSAQQKTGQMTFANWPLYMDKKKVNGDVVHPSLEAFKKDTGITVDYEEVIDDYASFFGKIQPQLAAGQSTGYDLMVMGYPKYLPAMIRLGYLIELDHDLLPTFEANVAPKYTEAPYDPGNKFSVPYQSGITGIGYDIDQTGREITSLQDLFSDEFKGKVGMFKDTEDTPNMALLSLGIDPVDSTPSDWQKARDKLVRQRDDGIVRQYFGQGYIGALQSGDAALSLAWAADVLISQSEGYDNIRFVVPDEGGLLWTDSMCIPIGAQHPLDAITYMDYIYRPETAAMMTDWIQGVSPVPKAQQVLHAEDPKVAANPLVFPTEDMYTRMKGYRTLTPDEQTQWDDLFTPVYNA